MDGQEEGLDAHFLDQFQFMRDLSPHRLGRAVGKALVHAVQSQATQPLRRGPGRRHQFGRVAVLQLARVEAAALGDVQGLVQPRGRIERFQRADRPQVALAVGCKLQAAFGHWPIQPQCGQYVEQGASAAAVHAHIAAGADGQTEASCDLLQCAQPGRLAGAERARRADPQPGLETCPQPFGIGRVRRAVRDPDCQHTVKLSLQHCPINPVLAIVRAAPGLGDQAADACIAGLVGCKQQ